MDFWIIPLVLALLAIGIIAVVLWRKIPQLRMIDVSSIPTERSKLVKQAIIRERVQRLGNERLGVVTKAGGAAFTAASKAGRRAVQRLYKMEQYYQKMKQVPSAVGAGDAQAARKLLDEAEELVRQEEYIPAEKRYIEVISHNPKMVEAYEGLGNLYLKNKSYGQARETLEFTLRLAPEDASVHWSFADLEKAEGNLKAALGHLRSAVAIHGNSPKYLDAYIEMAFEAGSLEDARKGIDRMKEANPENQKIPDWESRLTDPSQTT